MIHNETQEQMLAMP